MCGGVRQGDSLSPMLHMVSVEVLACKIRDSSDIVGFSLPSAQGRQYYRLPRWVIDHLNKLIWSFLWGSKIETVSRHTVFYHARDSGLGLVNFSLKAKALCLASLLRVLDDPSSARFTSLGISAAVGCPACPLSGLFCGTTAVKTRFLLLVFILSVSLLPIPFVFLVIFFLSSKSLYEELRKVRSSAPPLHHHWKSLAPGSFLIKSH